MNKLMTALIIGLFFVVSMSSALTGVHGTVYKGEGTDTTAGYAEVKVSAEGEYETTGCNASGGYGISGLDGNKTYYCYAWKNYARLKWTDASYEFIAIGHYELVNFHLQPGEQQR